MLSRYGMICEVADSSFTSVAQRFGYAQSSVSQAIRTLENEIGTTLLERRRHQIIWTEDGKVYEPYLRAIYAAEQALEQKRREMTGMENAVIRIGTFTSVSRDILPRLMMEFRRTYPHVRFELQQGEYNSIRNWLEEGSIDLGFIAPEAAGDLDLQFLYEDEMLAVLPKEHPLSACRQLSLEQLSGEPFILLDEGKFSTPLQAFQAAGIAPQVAYKVYDDYSILSMVKSNLGVALLFRNVVEDYAGNVAIRPLDQPIRRRICLACRDRKILSYSAAAFRWFIIQELTGK